MKKRVLFVVAILLLAATSAAVAAPATYLLIDGESIVYTKETGSPFIDENNRTQVPFRQTLESFGCEVAWNAQSRTAIAIKDGILVEVPVGESYIIKDGQIIENDTVAIIKNGRTYLPIRVVLEAFGYDVSWDSKTKSVIALSEAEGTVEEQRSELEEITIHFIDVGQGDSVFIDAGVYEILIDAGSVNQGYKVSRYIKAYVDDALDLVIATHMHEDHIGGFSTVFQDYNVTELIYSGESCDTDVYYDFFNNAYAEDCYIMPDGDISFTYNDLQIDIIETLDDTYNSNNNSVATLITYGKFKMLTNGDGEKESETILKECVSDVDVWKAGHHGSDTSNTKSLLSVIKPEYSVISAGKDNEYGHPDIMALNNLFEYGQVLGTFKSGTIVLITDGTQYRFDTDKYLTYSDAGTPKEYPYYDYYEDYYENSNFADDYYDQYYEDYNRSDFSGNYIGNRNSKVFHEETCSSVDRMKDSNIVHGYTRQELISKGYDPCDRCNP